MEKVIELIDVDKNYYLDNGEILRVLNGINLEIYDGEFICIIGPSGSGKSTIFRLIAGLEKVSDGEILIKGQDTKDRSEKIGMVFQEYSLFPWRKVIDNVSFGLEIDGVGKAERYEISKEILVRFGLEGFIYSYPHELSGGMRQRVAIAKAMVDSPDILLMDEPFGALDPQTRISMQNGLIDFWRKDKKNILFVTHSIEEAILLSNRIIILEDKPANIKHVEEIGLEYPRDKYSPKFKEYYDRITNLMNLQEIF